MQLLYCCTQSAYSGMVLDIVYTKEEDRLIDTNQEAISYHVLIYKHMVFLREAHCSF